MWRSFFGDPRILDRGKGSTLTRTARILFSVLTGGNDSWLQRRTPVPADADDTANPVAHVRDAHSWEYGPFVNWGTGVGDRSDYKFFSGGFQLGKPIYPCRACGHLERPV